MIARIEQKPQRHLENLRHFVVIRRERERWPHHADHRRNAVAVAGDVGCEPAENFHALAGKPHLLRRFAQRGVLRREITRLRAAAGKTDLPGAAAQTVRTHGEQHRRHRLRNHRHQHRCRALPRCARQRLIVAVKARRRRRLAGKRPPQPIDGVRLEVTRIHVTAKT